MTTARAVWFERPGIASIRSEALREPGRGEAQVRVLVTGISAGTERLVLSGKVPDEMRAAMALPAMRGSFDLPISYGYAAVGVVEAVGEDVDLAIGTRVFSLHPHHDRFVADAKDLARLPNDVPLPRLVLAPNLETAVNVVWDAGIMLGDRVVVVGLGVVGLLVSYLAARAGAAEILGVDLDPARRALALDLGATDARSGLDASTLERADVLIEASGSPEALGPLVAGAGLDARVVIASWYGTRAATLSLGGLFHPHRARILSSQVGRIAPARRDRWDHERRFDLVRTLLHDPKLDRLIAEPVPLAEAPRLYSELARGITWSPPQRVFDCE